MWYSAHQKEPFNQILKTLQLPQMLSVSCLSPPGLPNPPNRKASCLYHLVLQSELWGHFIFLHESYFLIHKRKEGVGLKGDVQIHFLVMVEDPSCLIHEVSTVVTDLCKVPESSRLQKL